MAATNLSDEMRQALDAALEIPRSSRPVFDFLFEQITTSPFHQRHILTPAHLSHAVSLCSFNDLNPLPNPRYPPYLAGLPPHVPFPDHLVTFPPPTNIPSLRSFHHDVYLPIASIPPSFTVGYVFCHDPTHSTICFRANPFAPPHVARFVFDLRTTNILCVIHNGIPKSIGLKAILHYDDKASDPHSSCTEHFQIVVPAMDYQWPYLPNKPLWMFCNVQYRTISSPPTAAMASSSDPQSEADIEPPFTPVVSLLDLLDEKLPLQPFPSRRTYTSAQRHSNPNLNVNYQPWPISLDGSMADGTSIPSSTNSMPLGSCTSQTAEMFDSASLQRAMRALLDCVSGSFYAPSMRADTPLPLAQFATTLSIPKPSSPLQSTYTGRVLSTVVATTDDLTFRLRERFAHIYYNTVLSARTDRPFVFPSMSALIRDCTECIEQAETEQFEQDILSVVHSSGRVQSADVEFLNQAIMQALPQTISISETIPTSNWSPDVRTFTSMEQPVIRIPPLPIAPRPPQPIQPVATHQGQRHQTQNGLNSTNGYASRDEMLKARRARNRLSAARSNERKKLWIADLERQVEDRHKQIALLKERQAQAFHENRLLKSQLRPTDTTTV